MSEVKLLPLPEPGEAMSKWAYHETDMEAYARANMEPLLAEIEALRAEVRELKRANDQLGDHGTKLYARAERLAEALQLALDSHGVTLLTDPPQDAWKARGVEAKARAALNLIAAQETGRG